LFRGTIDAAAVYPREVVKEALRVNAAAVIFSHNHPSGNPEPSQADRVLTQRLKEALALVDVRILDHISVGARRPCHLQSRRCFGRRGLRPSFLLRFPILAPPHCLSLLLRRWRNRLPGEGGFRPIVAVGGVRFRPIVILVLPRVEGLLYIIATCGRQPWSKGKQVGQKNPLRLRDI